MIVKIVDERREYNSHVFCKLTKRFRESIIIFDDLENKFKHINYDSDIKIYMIDNNTENMIEKDLVITSMFNKFNDCIGYKWILEDVELINCIITNKKVDSYYINKGIEMNKLIKDINFNDINDTNDIKELMYQADNFIDSTIRNIIILSSDENHKINKIQVSIETKKEKNIILEFSEEIKIASKDKTIKNACIFISNGYIYWVNSNIKDVNEINTTNTYFRAKTLKWKLLEKVNGIYF